MQKQSPLLSLYIGNLYFANVLPTDGLEPGLLYLCAVFNRAIRGLVQGDDQRIDPVVMPGTAAVPLTPAVSAAPPRPYIRPAAPESPLRSIGMPAGIRARQSNWLL